MEEILASIRRIMADDELPPQPRRPSAAQPAPVPRYSEPPRNSELPRNSEANGARRPGPDGRGMPVHEDPPVETARGPSPRNSAPLPRAMMPEPPVRQARAPSPQLDELDEAHPPGRTARGPQPIASARPVRAPLDGARRHEPEPDMQDFEQERARTVRPLRNEEERTSVLRELQSAVRPESMPHEPSRAGGSAYATRSAGSTYPPRPLNGEDAAFNPPPRPAPAEWLRAEVEGPDRPAPREAAAPSVREDGPRRRDLLSPGVDAAVAAAFQSLGDVVLPHKERTVEDLVKEILRPMLKDWLDQHLPGIVEGLVRAEIERVSRQPR